jgi:mannosyltransferase OCH1-like enzyme
MNLELPVQKADLWRYLIIYHYGGWYCDMDIYSYRSFSSIKIPPKYKNVLVVEMESPAPFKPNTSPRCPQYAQYWFGATPRHPVLFEIIKKVINNIQSGKRKTGDNETLYLTGPVPFTDMIEKYKRQDVYVIKPNTFDTLSQPLYWVSNYFSEYKNIPVVHRCDGSWREKSSTYVTAVVILIILLVIFYLNYISWL